MANKVKIDQSTEERILDAAKKVFISKGMSGARMQDIADEAGINKALLHYYFRSKEKLFETIFKEIMQQVLPVMSAIIESDKPLFEKIKLFCNEYIENIKKAPFIPIFILSEVNKQPEAFVKKMWGNRKPPVQLFFQQVEKEIKQGIIKPIHPAQLMMNLISMCIFPFAARPMFQLVGGINPKLFDELIEQRKKHIPEFIIASIKK